MACTESSLLTCTIFSTPYISPPNGLYYRYEYQKHSSQSYFVIFLALIVSGVDLVAGAGRLLTYVKAVRSGDEFSIRTFWRAVVGREEQHVGLGGEYTNLVSEEPEELEEDLKAPVTRDAIHVRRDRHMEPVDTHGLSGSNDDETVQWANDVRHHHHYPEIAASERTLFGPRSPRSSQLSDDTLHETTRYATKASRIRKVGHVAFAALERTLVFAAFGQLLFGVTVYTGGCRDKYVNGCLAHLISGFNFMLDVIQQCSSSSIVPSEGGIFWCYVLYLVPIK